MNDGGPDSVRLCEAQTRVTVPMILCHVPAGFPSPVAIGSRPQVAARRSWLASTPSTQGTAGAQCASRPRVLCKVGRCVPTTAHLTTRRRGRSSSRLVERRPVPIHKRRFAPRLLPIGRIRYIVPRRSTIVGPLKQQWRTCTPRPYWPRNWQ